MKNKEMQELKERFDVLFNFSSQISYVENHLLQVVQSCKSLIGVSSKNIPRALLSWLDDHIKNFKFNNEFKYDINIEDSVELLTTFELEKMIAQKDNNNAKKYLHHLIKVSDPRYLMEILFEISLLRSKDKILFCWAGYKTVKFMNPKDSIPILFLSLDCLMKDDGLSEEKESMLTFFVFCHSWQIMKTDMVRIESINLKLIDLRSDYNGLSEKLDMIPKLLLRHLRDDKINGFGNYLSDLKTSDINVQEILLLDAIRAFIMYGDKSDKIFKKMVDLC